MVRITICKKYIDDITWPPGDTKFLFEFRKNVSFVRCAHSWHYFSTLEEKFCICKRPCNGLLYYINTNEIPSHFTLIAFWCERCDFIMLSHCNRDIFTCEDNVLFSHVTISSFRAKAHLAFKWCLYNKELYSSVKDRIFEYWQYNSFPTLINDILGCQSLNLSQWCDGFLSKCMRISKVSYNFFERFLFPL